MGTVKRFACKFLPGNISANTVHANFNFASQPCLLFLRPVNLC